MPNPTRYEIDDEAGYARAFIEHLVETCPRRRATSADERRAQELTQEVLEGLGLSTHFHPFTFNDSLYATMALHFGVGVLGSVVSGRHPALGLLLHSLSGGSYWLDSVEYRYLLRRLLPHRPSQNLLAVLPATDRARLRIVIPAHVDAGFAGLLFHPEVIRRSFRGSPRGLKRLVARPLATSTYSQLGLAGVDLARVLTGRRLASLRPLEWIVTIPALVAFLMNLQMVLRDETVPGAADNLSGVAGLVLLAARLAAEPMEHVEIVFAVTGCEEAGRGGAAALARDMQDTWPRDETVWLGLDTLSNGEARYLEEGEVRRVPTPRWLVDCLVDAARGDPRFDSFGPLVVPAGASDIQAISPFGYEGVCISCIDPSIGAARHYHSPTDTPSELDYDNIVACVDLAERAVENIIRHKLGE